MNILITGGAGFVGSNLARLLQQTHPDADLCVVDDLSTGTTANLRADGVRGWSYRGQLIAGSVAELDLTALADEFEPDVVFHEASITDTTIADERTMMSQNVQPFKTLLRLATDRGIRLVWASSAATYGRSANGAVEARRPFETADAGRPANAYGFSKWVMENLHRRALRDAPGSHLVGLRYFNVFGPGEQNKGKMASMVYKLAQAMLSGQAPRIFRDGEQARDQVFVQDAVQCTMAAMANRARPGIYNVGSGTASSFNQLVAWLNEAFGTQLHPEYFENPYPFYQNYTCADLGETAEGLGWSPRHTTRDGVLAYAAALKAAAVI